MKKFDWKPKKGSFKKIQESYLKKQVLKEEATPEQIAMSKKIRFGNQKTDSINNTAFLNTTEINQ